MPTITQLEANKANAQKSTGPKTVAGKARSRANAWKHGLTAEVLVTRDEEAGDFSELRDALMEEHDPQTTMECDLVERIAGLVWRLRRVPTFEAGVIDYRLEQAMENERSRQEAARESPGSIFRQLHESEQEEEDPEQRGEQGPDLLEQSITLGDALTNDFGYTNSLQKLGRHETSLTNLLKKTYEMLWALQGNRKQAQGDDKGDKTPRLKVA